MNLKKIASTLLLVCIIFALFNLQPLTIPEAKASGANWLEGWNYRKSHVVNNATGAGSDYQISILIINGTNSDSGNTVYINNKTRSDWADLRITDDDGLTLLSAWNQSQFNGKNITIWVKVADDLSSSNVIIYLYYNNPEATSYWNFDNTFIFGDPFDSTTLNTNRWTSVDGDPVYTIDAVNHYLEVTDMALNWWNGKGFHSKALTYPSSWMVQDAYADNGVRLYHHSTVNGDMFGQIITVTNQTWSIPTTNGGIAFAYLGDHWGGDKAVQRYAGVGFSADYSPSYFYPSLPLNVKWKIWKYQNTTIKITEDGTERVSEDNTMTPDRFDYGITRQSGYTFGTTRLYAFLIRNYVSPEPVQDGWGEEEEFKLGCPEWSSPCVSSTETNFPMMFCVYWVARNYDLDKFAFGWNATAEGSFLWFDAENFAETNNTWSNVTKTPDKPIGTVIEWKMNASNTEGILNITDSQYLTLTATITFLFTGGGSLRRNTTDVENGTSATYDEPTNLELLALASSNYGYLNMTWAYGVSTSNPVDFEVQNKTEIWCYFAEMGVPIPYIFACFTFSPSSIEPDTVITFNASLSNSSSPITEYYWDFNDSTTDFGEVVYHNYSSIGNFTVSLTVTSSVGNSTFQQGITVAYFTYQPSDWELYPLADLVVMFIVGLFFSSLFLGTRAVAWGAVSFVAWVCMGFIWLLINPLSYSVALLFSGIATIILILTLLVQLEKMKQKGEESDL